MASRLSKVTSKRCTSYKKVYECNRSNALTGSAGRARHKMDCLSNLSVCGIAEEQEQRAIKNALCLQEMSACKKEMRKS